MNNFFISIILVLLVFSCNSTKKDSENSETNIDKFRTYPIDVDIPSTSIFDYIESVEVLGLEETDESLLTGVFEPSFLENHIVFKNGRDEVFIYSGDGEYLAKIDDKGNGPEEYIYLGDLWINGSLIEIYDTRGIISYDLNGDFVKSMKLQNRVSHLNSIGDGYVSDVSRSPVDDTLKYELAFLNANLERGTLAIPYDTRKKTSIFWVANTFSRYNDDVLYQHTNGDTIYKLAAGIAKPLLSVDFGEKWLWKDKEVYEDLQKQKARKSENGAFSMFFMKVSKRLVYIDARGAGTFLLNRQSGNYQKLSFDKSGEGRHRLNQMAWQNGKMVYSVSSSDIGEFLGELPPSAIKFIGGSSLTTIESSENPVLIWVKFKDML